MIVTLYYLGVCVLGEWGVGGSFLDISTAECVLKRLPSIHIKTKSEKYIPNMTTIFYLYDCISFSNLP